MNARVRGIVAGHVLLASAVGLTLARSGWSDPGGEVVAFACGFALLGFFPMHLELRAGRCTVTPTYALYPVALFLISPLAVGLAAAAGEAISLIAFRVARLKIVFDVASRFLASVSGALLLHLWWDRPSYTNPAALLVALAAVAAYEIVSIASTSLVLAAVDDRPLREVVGQTTSTSLLAAVAIAPIGLVALDLASTSPLALLALVPLVVGIAVGLRRTALLSDEHLRVERLYGSFSRTARLRRVEDAVGEIAAEAAELVTASHSICCVRTGDLWIGVRAGGGDRSRVSPAVLDAIVTLVEPGSGREFDVAKLPEPLHERARGSAVAAATPRDSIIEVVLVAFRDVNAGSGSQARVETLRAYSSQAALALANAQLYDEVERALERQIDLNRQEGEFVAAVSHELRTPLAGMLLAIETVMSIEQLDATRRTQVLERAVDEGARLGRLINDLLLVAAAEHTAATCDIAPVRLGDLVEQVASTVESLHGRAPLVYSHPWADAIANTDATKAIRILCNLAENATKYAPDGAIELHVRARDDEFAISVVDHGPGVPLEDRERVFQRFVQLDQSSTRRQGGVGLGLYLCAQLAAKLSGTLDLTETPGGGATFTLTLPRNQQRGRERTPELAAAAAID